MTPFEQSERTQLLRGQSPRAVEVARTTPGWFWGRPVYVTHGTYLARFGQQVICDAAGGSITVVLPRIELEHVGLPVVVCNAGSSGTITVEAPALSTISGARSLTIDQAYDQVLFNAASRSLYLSRVSVSETISLAGDVPLWKWNGTDLTQFDAVDYSANGVLTASASVVSLYGVNWVEIDVTGVAGTGAYPSQKMAFLPISASFGTPDYRVEAECFQEFVSGTTNAPHVGLAARVNQAEASTHFGSGVVGYWRSSGSQGHSVMRVDAGGTATTIRESNNLDWSTITNAERMANQSLSISGDAVIKATIQGQETAVVDGSCNTAELKAGLIAGADGGYPTNPRHKMRFRNIKVWAAS